MIQPREKELLENLADGAKQAQVAERMKVSHSWVRMTLHRLTKRFGAETSSHMIAIAFRKGYLK